MKTIHNRQMVAHLWANQSQSEARTSTGNFYFQGATIYSYGSHFPIATIHKRKGRTLALFTGRSYSMTTSGHQCAARRAASHIEQVIVENQGEYGRKPDHKRNLAYFDGRIEEVARAVMRARSNAEWLKRQVEGLVNSANLYCEFFGLKKRFQVPSAEEIKRRVEKHKEAAKRQARKAEKAQQEFLAKQAQELERWKQGHDTPAWHYFSGDIALRIKGDTLQTSRGAEVPLDHARRIWPLIRDGQQYLHNGHSLRVGHFRIDSIDAEGNIQAGCHYIKRAEIDRIAKELNLV